MDQKPLAGCQLLIMLLHIDTNWLLFASTRPGLDSAWRPEPKGSVCVHNRNCNGWNAGGQMLPLRSPWLLRSKGRSRACDRGTWEHRCAARLPFRFLLASQSIHIVEVSVVKSSQTNSQLVMARPTLQALMTCRQETCSVLCILNVFWMQISLLSYTCFWSCAGLWTISMRFIVFHAHKICILYTVYIIYCNIRVDTIYFPRDNSFEGTQCFWHPFHFIKMVSL